MCTCSQCMSDCRFGEVIINHNRLLCIKGKLKMFIQDIVDNVQYHSQNTSLQLLKSGDFIYSPGSVPLSSIIVTKLCVAGFNFELQWKLLIIFILYRK